MKRLSLGGGIIDTQAINPLFHYKIENKCEAPEKPRRHVQKSAKNPLRISHVPTPSSRILPSSTSSANKVKEIRTISINKNIMSGEEIATKIKELGAIIAAAKAEKKPIEEWKPSLDEMLVLKVRVWCRYAKRMFMF